MDRLSRHPGRQIFPAGESQAPGTDRRGVHPVRLRHPHRVAEQPLRRLFLSGIPVHPVHDLVADAVHDDSLGELSYGGTLAELDIHEPDGDLVEEDQSGLGDGYAGLLDGDEIPVTELLEDAAHAPLAHADEFCQSLTPEPLAVGKEIQCIVDIGIAETEHRTKGGDIHDFHCRTSRGRGRLPGRSWMGFNRANMFLYFRRNGQTQKCYVRFYDMTNHNSQVNAWRAQNGLYAYNIPTDPNDPRVAYARTRAVEVAYSFSHKAPISWGMGIQYDPRTVYNGLGYASGGENIANGTSAVNSIDIFRDSNLHNIAMLATDVTVMTTAACEVNFVQSDGVSICVTADNLLATPTELPGYTGGLPAGTTMGSVQCFWK